MKKYLFFFASIVLTLILPQLALADSSQVSQAINVLNPSQMQNGTDLSVQYLADIFGVVDGVLHGSGSQIMGHMFAAMNAGALALGGIIVMYTLIVSILNTAHEGTPLGREWSSMWIPIRSALGIALLLPKATGYSLIQIFIMWVVLQGVGLADSVWNNALLYVGQGGMIVQQELPPPTTLSGAAGSILQSETCMFAMQAALQQAYQDAVNSGNTPTSGPVPNFATTVTPIPQFTVTQPTSAWPTCKDGTTPCVDFPGPSSPYGYSKDYDNLQGVCGQLSWQSPLEVTSNATMQQSYSTAEVTAVQQMILDLEGPAQTIASTQLQLSSSNGNTPPAVNSLLSMRLLGDTIEDFQGIIEPAVAGVAGGGGANSATQAALLKQDPQGWITASTIYSTLTQANTSLARAANPKVVAVAPSDASMGTNGANLDPFAWGNDSYSQQVVNLIDSNDPNSLNSYISSAIAYTQQSYAYNGGTTASGAGSSSTPSTGNKIVDALPLVGPIISIVHAFTNLTNAQQTHMNPVIALSQLGNNIIDAVVELWLVGIGVLAAATAALSGIPCAAFGTVALSLVQWIIPLLWAVLGLLFVNGCVMAYYIPLIPFILFTFGALGWFITVIEAMVAGPLIALGITHPEGQPVLGKADPALLLIVSVFIRPTTMVIGFIAGIIMSYVGVWLLNQGFFGVAFNASFFNAANGSNGLSVIFAFPMILTIYTILVIMVMHESFNLIFLGDRIMRWLGAQGEQLSQTAERALGEVKGGVHTAGSTVEREATQGLNERTKAMKPKDEGDGQGQASMPGGSGGDSSGPSEEQIVSTAVTGVPAG